MIAGTTIRPSRSPWSTSIRIVTFVLMTACLTYAQQAQPLLQITAPADGTIVNPGQTITVNVTSSPGVVVSAISVLAEDPLDVQDFAASTPAQISVTIPASLDSLRRYMVTAFGLANGQVAKSQTIFLDVERPDQPIDFFVGSDSVDMESQGQQTPIKVFAVFSDGSLFDVTESSNVTYSTSNGSIISVDANGMITAGATFGGAFITATYGQGGPAPLSDSIPVTVERPILTPAPSSLSFGGSQGVNVGTSVSAQITLTNSTVNPTVGVTSITAAGDYSETDNCVSASPLPVGGTCSVSVTFAPTAGGIRASSLTVANNFTVAPAVIPLIGNANNNFALSVSPGAQTVVVGTNVSFTATVSLFNGFSGAVSLSATGLPAGATATFTPQSLSADGATSMITIATSAPTPPGSYPFTVSGTNGNVTLSAAATLTVIPPAPDLYIVNVAGNFSQGTSNAQYTLEVFNIGELPTTGTVTVTDTFSTGFTPTAISGDGWNCVLATLTCTRSDALPTAGMYPLITVTGSIAYNAPPTVTSVATVSGGGELNTANDISTVTTPITQLADLTITKSHAGNFTPGQVGATYTLTVSNVGFAPTNGTVNVSDSPLSGLTLTGLSGTGWSCSFQANSGNCTRSDALAVNASYPPITVTANVSSSLNVISNIASATGGGEVNTANDSATDAFTFDGGPGIVMISPVGSVPVGTVLNISGVNFGSPQGTSTISIGGVVAAPIAWTNSIITVPVPYGVTVGSAPVVVTVNGKTVTYCCTVSVTPYISGISPAFGPVGTIVTVSGTTFGATQGSSTITFAPQPGNSPIVAAPTNWSDTSIQVPVPSGAASGLIQVNIPTSGGIAQSNYVNFDLSPPSIASLSNSFGPAGSSITINGSNFGSSQGSGTVTFNGIVATIGSFWYDSSIMVTVPTGLSSGNVVVTQHGVASNPLPFFVTTPTSFYPSAATSATPGLLQLVTTPSINSTTTLTSQDLVYQPAGDYLIQDFDTQAGVPNSSNMWAAGVPAYITATMQQTAGTPGTLFPEFRLSLNGPTGTPICSVIGTASLTATSTPYQIGCAPANNITLQSTDRYYLWIGVSSTAVSTSSLQSQLTIGRPPGRHPVSAVVTVPIQ
jgi:IPT/TIG domain